MSPGLSILAHPGFDMSLLGLERFHPFDAHRAGRTLAVLRVLFGAEALQPLLATPSGPICDGDLALAHTPGYREALQDRRVIARALEAPMLGWLPAAMLRKRLVLPMRLGSQATIDAARLVLAGGNRAITLFGGFHHAHAEHGEGFCLFADVPIAIRRLRLDGLLRPEDRSLIIDLDAHRGNGWEAILATDPLVGIFDLYNGRIYPGKPQQEPPPQMHLRALVSRHDTIQADVYARVLHEELPAFLDRQPRPRLAFYNAGTDILRGDRLGGFDLTPDEVLERDRFVRRALDERGIPWVQLPSGGYTRESHRVMADSCAEAIEAYTTLRRR